MAGCATLPAPPEAPLGVALEPSKEFMVGRSASFAAWTVREEGRPVALEIEVETHGADCEYRAAAVMDSAHIARMFEAGVTGRGSGAVYTKWPAAVWSGPADSRLVDASGTYIAFTRQGFSHADTSVTLALWSAPLAMAKDREETHGGTLHVALECRAPFEVISIQLGRSAFEFSENLNTNGTGVYASGYASHVEGAHAEGVILEAQAVAHFEGFALVQQGTLTVTSPNGTVAVDLLGSKWQDLTAPGGAWSVKLDRTAVLGGAGDLYGRVVGRASQKNLPSTIDVEASGEVDASISMAGFGPIG